MFISRILKPSILLLLAASVWWGCQAQAPDSSNTTPAVPVEKPVATEATVAAETPTETEPVVSVSPQDTDVEAGSEDNTVLILSPDEIITLDPYHMTTIHPDDSVASHLWDTLTLLNDNLQVEPNLAESWRLLNNFTWEFKLRPGISFHNGEPVNVGAVLFSIERARSLPGSLETFATDVALDKVEMVDDYTLRIATRQPVANVPYHFAFLEILPPVYYSATNFAQLAVAPVGSGPYQLGDWTRGRELILEAVPTYWKGEPTFSRLTFETVPSVEDRLAALRVNSNVLATDLPPIKPDEWNLQNNRLAAIESTQRMFIGLHIQEDTPLADKRVRQALNYGVNVEQIIDNLLMGYGERYGSWVNPPSNNSELQPWPYDPDLARDLLAQAGYQAGFTTTLRIPTGAYYQDVAIAEAIAGYLAKIGVTVEVEAVDWSTYTGQLLSGDVTPLFLLGLNSRGNGLEDVKNLSADFGFNPTGWRNFSFESTVEQAANTFNDTSQTRLLNEAQAIAYEEVPWLWLWRSYDFYGVSESLDWAPRRDGLVNLYKPLASSDKDSQK